jgi:hypothetical protein
MKMALGGHQLSVPYRKEHLQGKHVALQGQHYNALLLGCTLLTLQVCAVIIAWHILRCVASRQSESVYGAFEDRYLLSLPAALLTLASPLSVLTSVCVLIWAMPALQETAAAEVTAAVAVVAHKNRTHFKIQGAAPALLHYTNHTITAVSCNSSGDTPQLTLHLQSCNGMLPARKAARNRAQLAQARQRWQAARQAAAAAAATANDTAGAAGTPQQQQQQDEVGRECSTKRSNTTKACWSEQCTEWGPG